MPSKYLPLDKFKGFKVSIDAEKIILDNAQQCCDDIKAYCESKGWHEYADGWVVDVYRKTKQAVVHNRDHYRLTHLLEKGHLITNKKGGVGFTAPFPHIRPAFDRARPKYIEDIKNKTIIVVNYK